MQPSPMLPATDKTQGVTYQRLVQTEEPSVRRRCSAYHAAGRSVCAILKRGIKHQPLLTSLRLMLGISNRIDIHAE